MREPADSVSLARSPVDWLRSPAAIRQRCHEVLELGLAGQLDHFEVRYDELDRVVERVLRVTRAAYPDLRIPFHSRWGHFRAGGVDRVADFDARIATLSPEAQARARFELAITSVLLDAGAGTAWRYREPGGGVYARSEGLAVASYHMFVSGLFSGQRGEPLCADADGLDRLEETQLAAGFQVGTNNPMVGLRGRTELLSRLGSAMRAAPAIFGERARLGGLFDTLVARADGGALPARRILAAVLEGLGPIWPGRLTLLGVNLGDVWPHKKVGGGMPTTGLVPFHKLSQWLSYSLIEPLQAYGIDVRDIDELTGLAEYRNGGLFVDDGVIVPRRAEITERPQVPGAECVVEWRALTVALLDRTADGVRQKLGMDAAQLPLCRVLEGGTWAAGRQAAKEKRADGGPPIVIESDGTVF